MKTLEERIAALEDQVTELALALESAVELLAQQTDILTRTLGAIETDRGSVSKLSGTVHQVLKVLREDDPMPPPVIPPFSTH